MSKKKQFLESIRKAGKSFHRSAPILIGVMLLIGLVNALIPKAAYAKVFGANTFVNSIVGAGLGSILAGNPVTSYILGGEFLAQGISLVAVTAFIVAWVTVGIVQLPAEVMLLGKRFAITRNIVGFVFSIIVAVITTAILGVI